MMTTRRRATWLVAACGICLVLGGCSGSAGPPRYQLSGKITYDGKPVAFGWMVFSPEQGPGGSANIEDGRYTMPEGSGAVGGPHSIEVVAFASKPGVPDNTPGVVSGGGGTEPLFMYTFEADLPKETTTWDIAISSEDVKKQTEGK